MKSKKTSGNKEEGVSGCAKMAIEEKAGSLCNSSEERASGHIRELDDRISGNDKRNNEAGGSSGSEIKDDDLQVYVGVSESDQGIEDGKVREYKKRCGTLQCSEPRSPETIDVSGKGFNLFVEVFGPLDGISDSDRFREHVSEGGDSNKECSIKEDGDLSTCVKNKSEEEGVVGEQESAFNVNSLVWIKTKSSLWWPGIVFEASEPANNVEKSEKWADFHVRFFGNANSVWCSNSELKPFVDYFDQMSRQIEGRNFVGSVEKAVCEIGQRVRLQMTCRCFLKEGQTFSLQLPLESKDNKYINNALSLSQFQPARFVAEIRNLAVSVNPPGRIELTVMKSRISAYYCSTGHLELPVQLVKSSEDAAKNLQDGLAQEETNDDHKKASRQRKKSVKTSDGSRYPLRRGKRNCGEEDRAHTGKVTSSGKANESRERKKSKYLSYPYVDVNNKKIAKSNEEEKADEPEINSSASTKSTPRGRSNGATSGKRGSKKPPNFCFICSEVGNITASSSELLSQLKRTARGCILITGSEQDDSMKRFVTGFRTAPWLTAVKARKPSVTKEKPSDSKNLAGAGVLPEKIKEAGASEKKRVYRKSVKKTGESVDDRVSKTNDPELNGNGKRRRAKKKEKIIPAVQQSANSFVGTDVKDDNPNFSGTISFQPASSDLPENESAPKKRNVHGKQPTGTFDDKANPNSSSLISFQKSSPTAPEIGTLPEKSEECSEEPTRISVVEDAKEIPDKSCVVGFQQTPSDVTKTEKNTPEKAEGSDAHPKRSKVAELPDLNGNQPVEPVNEIPSGGAANHGYHFANFIGSHQSFGRSPYHSMPPGMEGLVPINLGIAQPPPVAKNLPNPNIRSSRMNFFQNTEFSAGGRDPNANANTRIISFGSPPVPVIGTTSDGKKTEIKERKRKQKTQQGALVIPNLNANVSDTGLLGNTVPEGIPILPEGTPQQKRGKVKPSAESGSSAKINEDPGGSILLNFVAESTLPAKETLVANFSRYGLLKESEIQINDDSSVQIVYERSSDAKFAFRSLERSNPFGEALSSFNLHCSQGAPKAPLKKKNFQMPKPVLPTQVRQNNPVRATETPDIAVMRQNVEMMKVTLERAGDTILPEMRARLETEIHNFLNKINNMGSSSS
ncbi:uncharacterized protein LOC127255238 [Andrographis paniculata]|uniref:uncharacterized protein LOC127255238 n=1 Tax=Andrographis paniculata TaxID=175694 RepID=UPI0021E6F9B2|nr:uncharacterized protein LOC127255238 [Andrographis paniculata]